jgi:hypothetical protein
MKHNSSSPRKLLCCCGGGAPVPSRGKLRLLTEADEKENALWKLSSRLPRGLAVAVYF